MEPRIEPRIPTFCSICGRQVEDSDGIICLGCLNASSIIVDGLTIANRGLNGSYDPADTSFKKVALLIQEGWTAPAL